jgi:hypothetical protein
MTSSGRVVAAFIVAPIIVPILVIAEGYLSGRVVMWEFFLGIGSMTGYGFAIILGIPAYFLYFRKLERVRFRPFLWFTLICSALFVIFWGTIMLLQDGPLALLSTTFFGYSAIFFLATAISVAVFYLIAFHRLNANPATK